MRLRYQLLYIYIFKTIFLCIYLFLNFHILFSCCIWFYYHDIFLNKSSGAIYLEWGDIVIGSSATVKWATRIATLPFTAKVVSRVQSVATSYGKAGHRRYKYTALGRIHIKTSISAVIPVPSRLSTSFVCSDPTHGNPCIQLSFTQISLSTAVYTARAGPSVTLVWNNVPPSVRA